MSVFSDTITKQKYAQVKSDGTKESWDEIAERVATAIVKPVLPELYDELYEAIKSKKFVPGGRYLYAAGKLKPNINNCFLLRAEDSREGWAEVVSNAVNCLSLGGGIGIDYSAVRPEGSFIKGLGGTATGPISLMHMVNEIGRHIRQGGSRRSAIYASLSWKHPDALKFATIKNWSDKIKADKESDFNAAAPLDGTNISIQLDDEFFTAYYDETNELYEQARQVYWLVIHQMLSTSEPGFQIDVGENTGETLRNACTEVTSSDDGDVCNLGSINLAQIDTLEEFERIVELGTAFLLCGTLYGWLPIDKSYVAREKNRRLGLGLMGLHEWLLLRGHSYDPNEELATWLEAYTKSTEIAARYADSLGISRPVKTRAIAPTGTLSIVSETSSGIEPLFCVAFKRRYLKGDIWHYQYVIDATAQRIIDRGVKPEAIEDAYSLAKDVERRVRFQAFVQKYVDHGISSTINLPAWDTEYNNGETVASFGEMLLKYLPELRGITCYADGSRGGQPLTAVSYYEAVDAVGIEFEEFGNENACVSGVCGI